MHKIAYILLMTVLLMAACNPFAPAYDPEGLKDANLLGDQTTIDGFFKLFKNAYELKDTSLYGRLFSSDFTFSYYDFDQGQEISWDRATEMNTSFNLFQSTRQINLDWNSYIEQAVNATETEAVIERNFNLTIVENEQASYLGTGRAKFRLRRSTATEPWRTYYWFDDSDF